MGSEVEAGPSGGRGRGLPAPAVAASPSHHPGQAEGYYQVNFSNSILTYKVIRCFFRRMVVQDFLKFFAIYPQKCSFLCLKNYK